MKYVIILGDGMADETIAALGNKTPLEYANTPTMDRLASLGIVGMVHTIPDGMSPGSDTANLSVLGYDPKRYYSGRSPLEALSIGVPLSDTDISLRCNVVTLSEEEEEYSKRTIIDHSAGEISTKDAAQLIEAVQKELENEKYHFYVGTSYRHLLVWDQGKVLDLVPPHDILGQVIENSLPEDEQLKRMMEKSYEILKDHPINQKRKEEGKNPANSCWFWGAGTRPELSSFEEKTGKKGAMISAVDLLKGIAVGAQMKVVIVEGANGGLHTNYEGKATACLQALLKENDDFVYVHVEAPDEMGHQGDVNKKIQAIEYLDSRIIKPIYDGLVSASEEFRLVILPDHPTPVRIRTHTSEDVPYLLVDSRINRKSSRKYNEKEAKSSGELISNGHELIDYLFLED